MKTKLLYLESTYKAEANATITGIFKDDRGNCLQIDQTIFYPQGGGQPSDKGFIMFDSLSLQIDFIRIVNDEVCHYTQSTIDPYWLGKSVRLVIDIERRLLHARYHTAGHLLGDAVEHLFPEIKAVKGHQFPNEAFVEFEGSAQTPPLFAENLERTLTHFIRLNLPVKTLMPQPPFRMIKIGDFSPIPCGGTHVATLEEIGAIKIRKIKTKKDRIKISYEL